MNYARNITWCALAGVAFHPVCHYCGDSLQRVPGGSFFCRRCEEMVV